MSEKDNDKSKQKDKQEQPDDEITDSTITIDVGGLDKLEEMDKDNLKSTVKQLQEAIVKLSTQNKQLVNEFTKLQKEKEDTQKQAILDKLKDVGYDIKPFETLSLEALQATAEALASTDKEFVVPIPREHAENDMKPKVSEPEAWDHVKKKMVPWSEFQYGKSEEQAD